MNSTDLKKFIIHHIIDGKVPEYVWENEFNDRKHLTIAHVKNGRIYDTNIPAYKNVNEYKKDRLTWCYSKTGKVYYDSVSRISKQKDKTTKNIIRLFKASLIIIDYKFQITTNPTDDTIVSIDYIHKPFNKEINHEDH